MNRVMTKHNLVRGGFTMVELLTALMISAIVLAAAATLGSAFSSASASTENIGKNQANLRYGTLRISELIRFSNSVISTSANGVVFWADDNADGVEDAGETYTVEIGADTTSLVLVNNSGSTVLLSDCSNIIFVFDEVAPDTRFVGILFDKNVNGVTSRYQVTGGLLCRADHKI